MGDALYLDCFSGLSGDMFLSGLIDLGLDPADVEKGLGSLRLPEHVHLRPEQQIRCGVSGTWLNIVVHGHAHACDNHGHDPEDACKVHTHTHTHDHDHDHGHGHGHHHDHPHAHSGTGGGDDHAHGRSFTEIKTLIARSRLPDLVKSRAISVFRRIGVVEAAIHGTTIEEVHFHEVGAVDSITDIVGGCLGLHLLGIKRVLASPLVEGRGTIRCAHGQFPLPAPATLALLQGVPLTQIEVPHELITPTGAALLAEFAESFAPLAGFTTERIGYGLGTRDLPGRPNVVRMLRGTLAPAGSTAVPAAGSDYETDDVAVLTTLVDDMTPERLAEALEAVTAAGALDASLVPASMKKGRTGFRLEVLAPPEKQEDVIRAVFLHTTTIGLRHRIESRRKLPRSAGEVRTRWGTVRIKTVELPGGGRRSKAEADDCARLAREHGIPASKIAAAAEAE